MNHALFKKHHKTLTSAVKAIRGRAYWSAYPEIPSGKIYGQSAKDDGLAAFKAHLNQTFSLDQPGTEGTVGDEVSPYGLSLGIVYPKANLDILLPAAQAAISSWRDAGIEARCGICLEILDRLNRRSFEMANAVMHTTGQGFMMAFQAGGPHAQDRALEAIAYAYEEMTRTPAEVTWQKQVGKDQFITLRKAFRIVPRGVAVVIGCSTFPTWNTYPGLFASLVTGNAVVVKPHHGAILPLALTVQVAREVLTEQKLDPNLVTLVANSADSHVTKDLLGRPEVKIVDYTGSSAFGRWIEQNATGAQVFTEKAGVNSVILDSATDLTPVAANLAFTLSLYSGQMCTTPQNVFIPKDGITAGGERLSFDEVARQIVESVDRLLGDPARAAEILGCIQNEGVLKRIEEAASAGGAVLRKSEPVAHPNFPEARVRSPLLLQASADQRELYTHEMFGPISYLVATENTAQSIELAAQIASEQGAITCSVYSTDPAVLQAAEEAAARSGAALSCNLTGQIFVNQSTAFSDFHVSGVNPAGNATLCDGAFVANRFRIVQTRVPVASEASATA